MTEPVVSIPRERGCAVYVACPCSIAEGPYARLEKHADEKFGCEVTIRSIARGERRLLQRQCATRTARTGIRGGRSQDIRGATCAGGLSRPGRFCELHAQVSGHSVRVGATQ